MKALCKLALVLLALLFIPKLRAQQYYFKNVTVADGLPQALIYKTIEDSLGYIWLSTSKGIIRYNGTDFTEYGAENGLTERAFFFASRQPGTNTLFFLSNSFKLFVYRNGRFTHIPSTYKLCWLAYDAHNTPYFLTRTGDIIRYDNGKLIPYHIKTSRPDTYYYLQWVNGGNFVMSKSTGVEYISSDQQRKILLTDPLFIRYHHNPAIYRANDQVLINTLHGLHRLNPKTLKIELVFPWKDKAVYSIIGDSITNDILVASTEGLLRFRNGIFDREHLEEHLDHKFILNAFRTSEGIYIFSTQEHGLYLSMFLSRHYAAQSGLAEHNIRYLGKDGKDLYAFSDNAAVYRFDRQRFYPFSAAGQFEQPSKLSFSFSGPQGLMFGTFRRRNRIVHIHNRKISSIEKETGIPVLQICVNDSFFLTYATPHIYDRAPGFNLENHSLMIKQGVSISTSNPLTSIWYLVDKERNHYYYTTDQGYMLQDYARPDSPIVKNLGTQVEFMMKVNASLIVAGTNSKGLALIKGNNDTIVFIGVQQGLAGNNCHKIDKTGNQLWVLTDRGLSRLTYTPEGAITGITNFNSGNILSTDLLNDFCIIDDTVYVANAEGVAAFSRHLSFVRSRPQVRIPALSINSTDTIVQAVYDLPYDMNNISVSYEYPSLTNAGKIWYRYILLKDNDTVTTHITTDKKLQLFSLASGRYTLLLFAMDATGVWSTAPAHITFHIAPVFWKSWWFITLISCLALVIIFIFFQYRNNANILKNKIIDSELKALRLHMNPHFIFNTLNSLQRFVLRNKPLLANEYIAKFSRLIRWVMEYSDKQEVSISDEIDFLNLYIELEQLRFDQTFQCNMIIDPDLSTFDTLIPPLVIQPFIENAVKYGLSGKTDGVLSVSFVKQGPFVAVSILDNGVGREQVKKEQEESGKKTVSTGIRYTEERLKLLIRNDSIKPVTITDLYDNHHAAGTKVELLIPILT